LKIKGFGARGMVTAVGRRRGETPPRQGLPKPISNIFTLKIGIRTTVIKTAEDDLVFVPNFIFISNPVVRVGGRENKHDHEEFKA